MPGWILERALTDGTPVYDIGYRVNGRTVRRKGGATRRDAESALIIALADIETGKIRAHTNDRLDVYAARWLERRAPFVEPGTPRSVEVGPRLCARLRHSAAAAWLIAGGQSLEYVRRQLGHASMRETRSTPIWNVPDAPRPPTSPKPRSGGRRMSRNAAQRTLSTGERITG